jgi:hypothetical protein
MLLAPQRHHQGPRPGRGFAVAADHARLVVIGSIYDSCLGPRGSRP